MAEKKQPQHASRTTARIDTQIIAEPHISNSPRTDVNAGSLTQQFTIF